MLLLVSGCSLFEFDLPSHRCRNEIYRGDGGGSNKESPSPDTVPPAPRTDTTLYISALDFDPGYDWVRDTAYGAVPCRIILYENGREINSFPVPDGYNPDMHHLVGGHIYTEYCTRDETIINRDGEEFLRLKGRECLRGLLVCDKGTYTLSQSRDGKGLFLRLDGDQVFARTSGSAIGDFNDPSYGPGGALYEYDGKVCFSYIVRAGSLVKSFIFIDTMSYDVEPTGTGMVLDTRMAGGQARTAFEFEHGYVWSDARIWDDGDGYAVTGNARKQSGGTVRSCIWRSDTDKVEEVESEGSLILYNRYRPAVITREELDDCMCIGLPGKMGGDAVIAYSPRDRNFPPYIEKGGRIIYKFNGINGYLTGLEMVVTPAS